MDQYFEFSDNIMATNCIETDIQSRANGCDFDLTERSGSVLGKLSSKTIR